jgi:phosphate transport system permease protein
VNSFPANLKNPEMVDPLPGRPRSRFWQVITGGLVRTVLLACTLLSILTTLFIVLVLATEAIAFFAMETVDIGEFLTGGQWSPLLGNEHHFGIWPLVSGTLLVATVAALVALPAGTVTALYLSEYAPHRVRNILKPVLEVLAGIPTVVYGFFALMVITPSLRWIHEGIDFYNALSAGIAVGVMIIPIVTSISEDAMRAVPRSLREGGYALGATKFDVSVKVVIPAALSGIVAAFLLAIARAVGETMIVALAAGALPVNIVDDGLAAAADPTRQVQTMTGYIVQIFLGDAEAGGVEYQSSYAVAAVLFVMTLLITWCGAIVARRFREAYE